MRTRLLIFNNPAAGSFMGKFLTKFAEAIDPNTIHTIYDETLEHGLTYKCKSGNYAMYQGVLGYAQAHRYDVLFIPRLLQPELLLSELESYTALHGNPPPFRLAACLYGYQDIVRSKARQWVYSQLATKYGVHLINTTILHAGFAYTPTHTIPGVTHVSDPIFESPAQYQVARSAGLRHFGLPADKYYVLYFGAMYYGKGSDLLLKAMHQLSEDSNIHCIMAGDSSTCNYTALGLPAQLTNVTRVDEFIPDADLGLLFACADVVVQPYRDTYSYGTSGVFVQSMLASKPVILPDIYPFNVALERYPVGMTFTTHFDDAQTVTALANAITHMYELGSDCATMQAATRRYVADITTWPHMVAEVLK